MVCHQNAGVSPLFAAVGSRNVACCGSAIGAGFGALVTTIDDGALGFGAAAFAARGLAAARFTTRFAAGLARLRALTLPRLAAAAFDTLRFTFRTAFLTRRLALDLADFFPALRFAMSCSLE
jgi:hypothetical protein